MFVGHYSRMYEFAVAPAVTSIRRRGVEIAEVSPASLGSELELESGDRIIKVNGRVVRDYLDFRFQTAGETELVLEVRKRTGEDWELQIERGEGEDVRLSFLYGNYTTLTSITEDEMQRIIEQRLSPQYVSIHATDLTVRAYQLGVDEHRADITLKLTRLLDAGIE